MSKNKFRKGILPVALLACASMSTPTFADTVVAQQTSVVTACGKLFDMDSNAAGLTAGQRAKIVQSNLDNALIASKNRFPAAVKVEMMNRNPIVTLDNFYIVTADGNTAARHQMTQMELAEFWASKIRTCIANSAELDKYISTLTGKYETKKMVTKAATRDDIAVAPSGSLFPIQLSTPISPISALIGDPIEAVVTHDVPLGPGFNSYLPAGTVALGQLTSANPYCPNHLAGKDGLTLNFYEFRTPDGHRVAIDGHIVGGLNDWKMVYAQPTAAECCGNTTSVKHDTLVSVHVTPAKGDVVGSWRGLDVREETKAEDFAVAPRLVLSRDCGANLAAGEPMLLRLGSTTTIAVAGRSM